MSYDQFLVGNARLVLLRSLVDMQGAANETILHAELDRFGHRRSRDWLRTQMRWLESVGAVKISEAGSQLVASITRAGVDHVERRAVIEDVARPSIGE